MTGLPSRIGPEDALTADVKVIAIDQAEDLAHLSATSQGVEPFGIGRVLRHVPVPVRSAIGPPGLAPFSERDLGFVNPLPCHLACFPVSQTHRGALGASSLHQGHGSTAVFPQQTMPDSSSARGVLAPRSIARPGLSDTHSLMAVAVFMRSDPSAWPGRTAGNRPLSHPGGGLHRGLRSS